MAHLETAEMEAASKERLAAADLIFAQPITPAYRVKHVATDAIRTAYAHTPIVRFPNLFFVGQHLGYADVYRVTDSGARVPLHGNLSNGHLLPLLRAWLAGVPRNEVRHRFMEFEEDAEALEAIVDRSFAAMKTREKSTDLAMSDYIEAHWRERWLFYTYNHPVTELMIECARRTVDRAGLKRIRTVTPAVIGEPLNLFFPPSLPFNETSGRRYAIRGTRLPTAPSRCW